MISLYNIQSLHSTLLRVKLKTKFIDQQDALEHYIVNHYIQSSNWIRALVLAANDGVLSIASIPIGVAVASELRYSTLLATLTGLVAWALSMAAGKYVSTSSRTDIEKAVGNNCLLE